MRRAPNRERQELFRRSDRSNQVLRAGCPPDLPASEGERLAGRSDRERAFGHVGKRRNWRVGNAVEREVFVRLVGYHDEVVFARGFERDGVFYVAPSQAAADLMNIPGRGPSEGEALASWLEKNDVRA